MTTAAPPSSAHIQSNYSAMSNQNNQPFYDEDIQRFDADTIRNRYGESWRNLATNVREVTQPDGSIIKEYFIEDPTLLEEMQPSSRPADPRSFVHGSDAEQHQPSQSRIAQIKAKFESKNIPNTMASPAATATTPETNDSRRSSRKQIDDLYARHRRGSNESIASNRLSHESRTTTHSSNPSAASQNTYHRSQSIGSDRSKVSSFRRFNSADEADEEVSRIHRQGEELRRQHQETAPMPSNGAPQPSNVQYEIVDEDGNPLAINGVQDLIKMSGVRAREVPQPDGTVVKEYVIDDPQLLSQFRSQQPPSPSNTSYTQQRQGFGLDAPPPPPRIPLRPPVLFRQGGSAVNDPSAAHIQQIYVLEPQRRYEYLTGNGSRVGYSIFNPKNFNGQAITDTDIRELSNAINQRLLPITASINRQPQQISPTQTQTQFHPPKPWYPAVDLSQRQRLGSDNQLYPNNPPQNIGSQPAQTGLPRSASSGMLNQEPYYPVNQQQPPAFNQSQHDWNNYRYTNAYQPRPQSSEPFQSSAQFLPQKQQQQQQQQVTRSTYSPPMNPNASSTFQQLSSNYPYRGQQQHGVRVFNDYNQQRTAMINDGDHRV